MRIFKHILYAVMLGTGMAACLSQHDGGQAQQTQSPATANAQAAAPVPAPANLVIAKGRVGHVRIGMPIADMRRQVPAGLTIADTTMLQEGVQTTAYLLHPQNEPNGIVVEQICEPGCRVWRIAVHSPAYKTAAGIGIGSKYGEVQQVYPVSYVSPGEGSFVAVSADAGFSFILDVRGLAPEKLAQLKPADVPANTIVQGILVY